VGFSRAKPQEKFEPYKVFHTVLEAVYAGLNGDMHYGGLLKERHIHLENHVRSGSYNRTNFARFVCIFISLSGPLSMLPEP
jgi:hypothetical protein